MNVERRYVYVWLLVANVLLFVAFLPLTLIPFGYAFGGGPEAAGMLFFYLLLYFSPLFLIGASVSVYGLLAGPASLRIRIAVWYLCLAFPHILFQFTDIGDNYTIGALILLFSLSLAGALAFSWAGGVSSRSSTPAPFQGPR